MTNAMKKVISGSMALVMAGTMMFGGVSGYEPGMISASAASVSEVAATASNVGAVLSAASQTAAMNARGRNIDQWSLKEKALHDASCCQCALLNAVYVLTGNTFRESNVSYLAKKSGAWSASSGTYREPFFKWVSSKSGYPGKYGFKVGASCYGKITDKKLINHLCAGGVAVAHVKGHFIAIVGYDNGSYRVIESAVAQKSRGLKATGWYTAKKLSSGNTNVDWYVLISGTTPPPPPIDEYFPQYKGNSGSIVDILSSYGVKTSFSYRTSVYDANNLSGKYGAYTGSSAQNTAMVSLAKSGKLRNPSAAAPSTDVYFPQYKGNSGSIVDILSGYGVQTSFDYRTKVYNANGLSAKYGTYAGSSAQNTAMVSLAKSGKLKKP